MLPTSVSTLGLFVVSGSKKVLHSFLDHGQYLAPLPASPEFNQRLKDRLPIRVHWRKTSTGQAWRYFDPPTQVRCCLRNAPLAAIQARQQAIRTVQLLSEKANAPHLRLDFSL